MSEREWYPAMIRDVPLAEVSCYTHQCLYFLISEKGAELGWDELRGKVVMATPSGKPAGFTCDGPFAYAVLEGRGVGHICHDMIQPD